MLIKYLFSILLLFVLFNLHAQIQTGVFRTPAGNTDYHQFNRTGGGAAVYINQIDSTNPILRLGSRTAAANGGVVFTVENLGHVGIGTSTPQGVLHIAQNDAAVNLPRASILLSRYWPSNTNVRAASMFEYSDGTRDKLVFAVSGAGGALTTPVDIAQAKMTIQADGNVGIGTTNPATKLAVNGTISAKEVNVTTSGWPDYVFRPDYQLTSLDSLSGQLKRLGHLPDMPPAGEVEKNGLDLGRINKLQQQKIEELTLYLIEEEKKIEALESAKQKAGEEKQNTESRIRSLESGNNSLAAQNKVLRTRQQQILSRLSALEKENKSTATRK